MMTSLKIFLGFLLGCFTASLVWFTVGNWSIIKENPVALSSLSGIAAILTIFYLALIIRFYIMNWRKR